MTPTTYRLLTACLIALALAICAPAAHASATQESTFQDDNQLIYAPPDRVARNLDTLRSLGVDRVRVTVLWEVVAPLPDSRTRPAFDATDPGAYPPGAWQRYDVVLLLARQRGIDVNFNITAPGPQWAMEPSPRADIADVYKPNASEFARFVAAVGRRYDGTYPDRSRPVYGLPPLPRVNYWSIWNEPNLSGWLTPTWERKGGAWREAVPRIYRTLADAGYRGLVATGHAKDTILIGETAPRGDRSKGVKRALYPARFIRLLYCLGANLRPLRGTLARDHGCRPDGNLRKFRSEHPVLFAATGFAHHPYNLLGAPRVKPRAAEDITLSVISRLTKLVDRAQRAAGSRRKLPIYLTEYGYQTRPPDPLGVSFARQAAFMDESEYMAYTNKRVRTLSQFLLVDDRALGNFQSGLFNALGRRKPAFAAYKQPIYVRDTSVRRGGRVKVWALLRSAPNGTAPTAEVQFRPGGSRAWQRLTTKRATAARGYLSANVKIPRSGDLRVAYKRPPSTQFTYSRTVRVTAR